MSGGEDIMLSNCFSDIISSGVIIHTIALGPLESPELGQLGKRTGREIKTKAKAGGGGGL